MSNSLRPHGLQNPRLPCPSPYPGACSNSCPLSWWCHPTTSSSITLFSSCLQSFPASGSFPVSQLLAVLQEASSIAASALASVLPMNMEGEFPFRIDWFDLAVQRTLKSLLQHHSLKAPILWHSAFFKIQFSHLYMTTGKKLNLWLYGPLSAKWCLCFLTHCLGLS